MGMKTFGFALMSGLLLVAVVLLIALGYVWMYPEGGDSWDARYFFTHPAFFIFTVGFILGISWKIIRFRRNSN
jgi:peptidoglycan/LPS O-acetylase OafA/YrhL